MSVKLLWNCASSGCYEQLPVSEQHIVHEKYVTMLSLNRMKHVYFPSSPVGVDFKTVSGMSDGSQKLRCTFPHRSYEVTVHTGEQLRGNKTSKVTRKA